MGIRQGGRLLVQRGDDRYMAVDPFQDSGKVPDGDRTEDEIVPGQDFRRRDPGMGIVDVEVGADPFLLQVTESH